MAENQKTIDLTPPAFTASNPNAARNIKNANAAVDRLDNIGRQKIDFLRMLVDVQFGGIDGLLFGLKKHLQQNGEPLDQIKESIEYVRSEYRRLEKEHSAASESLAAAMAGADQTADLLAARIALADRWYIQSDLNGDRVVDDSGLESGWESGDKPNEVKKTIFVESDSGTGPIVKKVLTVVFGDNDASEIVAAYLPGTNFGQIIEVDGSANYK